ncbi:MAG: hypothetical protein Q4C86_09075 [bacterium]|nr:hypothetical protein [bacterium]
MMIHRQPETKGPVRENITYKDLSNGDVEVCRALCDELMRHQAGVGLKYREILAAMNFDNKLHIGGVLMDEAMAWLRSYETAEHVLVYVSNGNDPAAFYAKYGFTFSHDVLNGFIKCYSANMARAASKQAASAC